MAMAFSVSGILFVGHRRDLGRIVNASIWTIGGFIAAEIIKDNHWLDYASFFLFGLVRLDALICCIVGGLIGWFIGCLLIRWPRHLPPPPPH